MSGETFFPDITERLEENIYYRHVVYTDENCQFVLMTIKPNSEIEREKHENTTQLIKIESGFGYAKIKGKLITLQKDSVLIIPPDTWHTIVNTSQDEDLLLYTLYSGEILHKHGLREKYLD